MKPVRQEQSVLDYCVQLVRAGREVPDALYGYEAKAKQVVADEIAQKKRDENRRRYPKTAAALDKVREFFPDAAVVQTTERDATLNPPLNPEASPTTS